MNHPAILYIDDEAGNFSGFKATYRKQLDIHTAQSAKEGLKILKNEKIKVVLSDQRMPGMKGTELFAELFKSSHPSVPILVSAYTDSEDLINGINNGHIFRFIEKPWDENLLLEYIEEGIKEYDMNQMGRDFFAEKEKENEEMGKYIEFKEKNKIFKLGSK